MAKKRGPHLLDKELKKFIGDNCTVWVKVIDPMSRKLSVLKTFELDGTDISTLPLLRNDRNEIISFNDGHLIYTS